jgi:hypothetical protein
MARKANLYRQLALAEALASFMPEKQIVKKFAQEWGLRPDSVRKMMHKLIVKWRDDPISKPGVRSLSPWKTSAKARERMNVLAEALANGEARGDVVRKYAAIWDLSTEWVDELITRVIVESQDEIHEQAQRELALYIERIHAHFARYADVQDWDNTSKAYERLTLLTKA